MRITAVKRQGKLDNILCIFWYSTDQRSNFTVAKALVTDLLTYTFQNACAYIKCFPRKSNITQEKLFSAPLFVGLINEKNLSVGHRILLQVENRDMDPHKVSKWEIANIDKRGQNAITQTADKNRVVEFTVCIPAMFNYRNAAQLVEKLEMVRLLGAGRVVLYNFYVGSNVRSVLQYYTQEWAAGNETLEVVVHDWKLPPLRLHYRGQLATVEDCLYRYGWLSKYMVFDDLDEFIVPLRHENWSELIAEREKLKPGYAAFMFLSTTMNLDHSSPESDFKADAFRYESSVLGITKRDDLIYPVIQRTKLIVNPRKIESLAVHHVYEGYGPTDLIPVDQGLVYHYRRPLQICGTEIEDTRVSRKYGNRLLVRLKSVWSKLKGVSFGWKLSRSSFKDTCIQKAKAEKKLSENKQLSKVESNPQKSKVLPQVENKLQNDKPSPQVDNNSQKDKPSPQVDNNSQKDKPSPQIDNNPQNDKPSPQVDNNSQKDKPSPQVDNNSQKDKPSPQIDNNPQNDKPSPQVDNNSQKDKPSPQVDNNSQKDKPPPPKDNNPQKDKTIATGRL